MKSLALSLALCVTLTASGAAQAALVDRGGGLIYDDVLNITWLQDANLSLTQRFGIPSKGPADSSFQFGVAADGSMNFNTASNWIGAMNAETYLGYSDW